MLRSIGKQSGKSVESVQKKKTKVTPRRICEKEDFKAGKRERDEIQYSLVEFARSDSA